MNSYRRGLRNGVLVNPKLFIIEKVNLDPHTNYWSNLVKRFKKKLVLFDTSRYTSGMGCPYLGVKPKEQGPTVEDPRPRSNEGRRVRPRAPLHVIVLPRISLVPTPWQQCIGHNNARVYQPTTTQGRLCPLPEEEKVNDQNHYPHSLDMGTRVTMHHL